MSTTVVPALMALLGFWPRPGTVAEPAVRTGHTGDLVRVAAEGAAEGFAPGIIAPNRPGRRRPGRHGLQSSSPATSGRRAAARSATPSPCRAPHGPSTPPVSPLAATFALIALVPVVPFEELAFAVALGVLTDAFLVWSLIAPAARDARRACEHLARRT